MSSIEKINKQQLKMNNVQIFLGKLRNQPLKHHQKNIKNIPKGLQGVVNQSYYHTG